MSADQLAKIAGDYFKPEQIEIISDLDAAITYAIEKATLSNQVSEGISAVLVTGSVVTAGGAKTYLERLASERK
jgi:dihydrofolate synthase/folylpolyglutamate synthase